MKIYFAHQMSIYHTELEEKIMWTIQEHFPNAEAIINPSSKAIELTCKALKDKGKNVMEELFIPLVEGCDIVVFTSFEDGAIGAGVWAELMTEGKTVIWFDTEYWAFMSVNSSNNINKENYIKGKLNLYPLSIEETRARIRAGIR